jgi:hypothetical protein
MELRKFALDLGLKFGLINIILFLALYFIGIEYMVNYWIMAFLVALLMGFLIYTGINYRKLNNGFISFKDAFLVMFTAFVVSGFVMLVFNVIFYNFVDPSLPANLKLLMEDKVITMMEKFNSPESEIEKAIERFENFEDQYTTTGLLIQYMQSFILGGIFAVIIGLFIKKKESPFTAE